MAPPPGALWSPRPSGPVALGRVAECLTRRWHGKRGSHLGSSPVDLPLELTPCGGLRVILSTTEDARPAPRVSVSEGSGSRARASPGAEPLFLSKPQFPRRYDGSPGGSFGGTSRRRRPVSANGTRVRSSSIRWAQSGAERGSLASSGSHAACGRGPGILGERCRSQAGALAAAATDTCRALLGSLGTLT